MLIKQTGSTLSGTFTTYDQDGLPFRPEVVQVSILKANRTEDLITYLGLEVGDSRLALGSVDGEYSMYYPIKPTDLEGIWYFNVRWQTTFLGETITCTLDEPIPFRVNKSASKWQDT